MRRPTRSFALRTLAMLALSMACVACLPTPHAQAANGLTLATWNLEWLLEPREHARLAQRNLREVLAGHATVHAPASMPAIKLIRRGGA